jgi:digeranylgeranylglycerophospholipid reductase
MYDVIIVGGGPVGSRVAQQLVTGGHKILILEKKAQPGLKTACTGIIGMECISTFDIDDSVILKKVNSASLFSPEGRCLHVQREEPQACILHRPAFDRSLAQRAERAGAEYVFQSRAVGIKRKNDCVDVTVIRSNKEQNATAKVVVIACGFNPGLLQRVGLGAFKDFVIGAQAEVAVPDCTEVEVYFGKVAPGFFAWLVPTQNNQARVGLLSRGNPGIYLKKWLDELANCGRIKTVDVPISYGGIPIKPLSRTYSDRLIVVGDAAGQVKPVTGGGIYYGLLCADIAAGTLHRALEDSDLSARSLSRYERGWRKKLGREIRTGYWFRRLYERLSERQIERLFQLTKAGGIDEDLLKAEDVSFDWHGRTIMKLLKYRMITRTLGRVKPPSKTQIIDR